MPAFKSWSPDLPDYGHDGLVTARNTFPIVLGYGPVGSPTAATAALPATWAGGGAFVGLDGTQVLLAATNAALYTLTASAATSVHTVATTSPWFFDQFGGLVIGVNGGAPVKYTISSGLAANLGGTPPSASMIGIVKDFVFLAGNSAATSTVYWSAINNAEGWTIGTDQCDSQLIPDGGSITGLVGGQTGIVFQADAINVFEYAGVPFIFTRRKISDAIGAVCQGSIARVGDMTFFRHRRGFYVLQGEQTIPIGEGLVDETFASTYTTAEVENNIRCTVDPERQLVIWSMPDRLWCYHWESKKWSDVAITGLTAVTVGRTASVTLEDIAVTYPSIEDVPVSFDDPTWRGGEPMLMIAKTDFKLHAFGSETNLSATLRMAKQEPVKGRETIVRAARVDTDLTSGALIRVDSSKRLGDSQTQNSSNVIRDNGDTPIRARGRYIQPEVTTDEGAEWSYIQGIDLLGTGGGYQ